MLFRLGRIPFKIILRRRCNRLNVVRRLIKISAKKSESFCINLQTTESKFDACKKSIENLNLQPIVNASIDKERQDVLLIEFQNKQIQEYPLIWLKDNCKCEKCFDEGTNSRIINLQRFEESEPKDISIENDVVRITWEDFHISEYKKDWLLDHSFDRRYQYFKLLDRCPAQQTWNSEQFLGTPACRTFSYSDVIEKEAVLLDWLESLALYGVAYISGTPPASGQAVRLANRIAFPRRTHYGTEFNVRDRWRATNIEFKLGSLQVQTDMPYYQHMPGVYITHCVVQSSHGGETILCDGLNASTHLNRREYRILADTVVDWVDISEQEGKQTHSLFRSPVLCEDCFGQLERINWNQAQRDSYFNTTVSRSIEWYKAMKSFCKIIHSSNHAVTLKMQPGDILTIDNRRILHGRTCYTDNRRLFIGAYVDWDQIYSKIRTLKQHFKNTE